MHREPVVPYIDTLPELAVGERFRFACHPGVPCFNLCCSDLELVLSPCDLLRLRPALGLTSQELLLRHVQLTREGQSGFPIARLRMSDDALQSCPFVRPHGCAVYAARPGACRSYPLGRGTRLSPEGQVIERCVLVQEPHCHGFAAGTSWSAREFMADQGLGPYERLDDRFMILLARVEEQGRWLEDEEHGLALVALYRLEEPCPAIGRPASDATSDAERLLFSSIERLEALLCG